MISIITVSHNSYCSLERLRQSLLASTSLPYEWIVVDSGSTRPETATLLAEIEAASHAKVMRLPDNRMFTKSTNVGIREAKGDPIVLLNPDCVVTPGWLEALTDIAARPKVGVVGTVLMNEAGMVVHAGGRDKSYHDGYGEPYRPNAPWAQERRHDGGWVTGACLLITRKALEAAGNQLDGRHPHYHSDRLLCERVRAAGFQIWMSNHVLIHSVGKAGW